MNRYHLPIAEGEDVAGHHVVSRRAVNTPRLRHNFRTNQSPLRQEAPK